VGSLGHVLAADAAAAAAPIRRRRPADRLPTWAYGTLVRLPTLQPSPTDILDGLTTLVALRHWLNWVEWRHLRRASLAHYVIKTSQLALAGDILGISKTGLIERRKRLARIVAERGQVKNSPSLPRIDLPVATAAAADLVERRVGLTPEPAPPPEDLIGAAAYAARWRDTPDLDQLADDIRGALTVVVCLRRHFDDIEADLLDLGRGVGLSNTALGAPFGRLGDRATWRARVRLRNGDRASRRRTVRAPDTEEPVTLTAAAALAAPLATGLRRMVERLLVYRPQINDEDLDVWLGWLADHAADAPTDRTLSLLWAAADEIVDDRHARTIDGLVDTAHEVLAFVRTQRTRGDLV
jgi:hypothetical protein